MNIGFGDHVVYDMGDGKPGEGFVIGWMRYAPRDVLLLATKDYIGMPINKAWCRVDAVGFFDTARQLRERYEERFPGCVAALPKGDDEAGEKVRRLKGQKVKGSTEDDHAGRRNPDRRDCTANEAKSKPT